MSTPTLMKYSFGEFAVRPFNKCVLEGIPPSITFRATHDGWEPLFNKINNLMTVMCATCAVRENILREVL